MASDAQHEAACCVAAISVQRVEEQALKAKMRPRGLPLTGKGCVSTVYSDIAVIDFGPDGPIVREKLDGLEFDELQDRTGVPIRLANDWQPLEAPNLD